MPTFDFRCTSCESVFEEKIPFGSKEYPPCPECGSDVQKLMTKPLGIVFKGKGFYTTDSTTAPAAPATDNAPKKADSGATPPGPSSSAADAKPS